MNLEKNVNTSLAHKYVCISKIHTPLCTLYLDCANFADNAAQIRQSGTLKIGCLIACKACRATVLHSIVCGATASPAVKSVYFADMGSN